MCVVPIVCARRAPLLLDTHYVCNHAHNVITNDGGSRVSPNTEDPTMGVYRIHNPYKIWNVDIGNAEPIDPSSIIYTTFQIPSPRS